MLHIDLPTRAEIDRLVVHRGAPAVSIYLATTPVTQDTAADRIELKNLSKQAVAQMEAGGVEKRCPAPRDKGPLAERYRVSDSPGVEHELLRVL